MLKRLIQDFPMVHASVGLAGNAMFVLGSVLFFETFDAKTLAIWLFVAGSSLMFLGAAGDWLLKYLRYESPTLEFGQDSRQAHRS